MASNKNHLLLGGSSILFGIIGLVPIVLKGIDSFIMSQYEGFWVKYFIIITFLNGSFFFIIIGFLLILGCGLPETTDSNYKKIKAKNTLLSVLIASPFLFSLNNVIFTLADNKIWYFFVMIFDLYFFYIFIKNIK